MPLIFPDLGLGILSWKGYDSITASLNNYKNAGFLDLFSEKLVFLPEIEPQGIEIAQRFSIPYKGSQENLGILGGFKILAESMTSKYLLLTENDYELTNNKITHQECFDVVSRGLHHIKSGQSHVWRFRNLHQPGPILHHKKILKYWPKDEAFFLEKLISCGRRIMRPQKSHRLKGMTVYTSFKPSEKFPDVIKKLTSGDYLVRSDVMNWANNLFLIERDFFLNQIIPEAEKNISGRLINGFPTIETELNRSKWWRGQKFWIGVSNPGLFTHDRKGDRGY